MGRHKIPIRKVNPKIAIARHERLVNKDAVRISRLFLKMALLLGIRAECLANAVDWGFINILKDRYKYIPGIIPMKRACRIVTLGKIK